MGAALGCTTAALLASILSVVPARAGDVFRDDLRYVPADATMVAVFEPWPGNDDLGLFRDELLESIGETARVQALADVLADARRVVLFKVPETSGGSPLVCMIRTERPIIAAKTLAQDLVLEPAGWSTALVGSRAEIRRALARYRSSDEGLAAAPSGWRALVDARDGAAAWGFITPEGTACEDGPCRRGDISAEPGSFARSVAELDWWTFSLRGADARGLSMRTRARTAAGAEVLADGLRGVLASLRLGARREPEEVRSPLDQARVQSAGDVVDLDLPSTGPVLRRLCRKDGCDLPLRGLLGWRLGLEEREANERVTEVLRRLGVTAGERVADVGSGLGFYTARLARLVGREGHAVAVEIDEDLVTELRRRAAEGFPQMEAVLGTAEDPCLPPESLDAVLIVNAYHEMPKHKGMLDGIRRALRPGGRLMLVEPFAPAKRTEPRDVQERQHLLAPELAEQDLREAGFRLAERDEGFVKDPESGHGRWLLLAERP